jgi:hypothetical protein
MPRSRFIFGCFLFLFAAVEAQETRPAHLMGRVLEDGEGVADVHVLNLSAQRATITAEDGAFLIPARAGDTLLFSAVQLQRKTLVVTPAMLQSLGIVVPLEAFVNELDEVVLLPYNLSGDISRDLQQIPREKVYVAATLDLPNAYVKPATQSERKLHEATTGGGIVPLNPILNAISGRTRYLKNILALDRVSARTARVRAFYADSVYVSELKIPSVKIDDFMYFCEVDSLFDSEVDTGDRLRIWEFLKRKSLDYRRNNGLD